MNFLHYDLALRKNDVIEVNLDKQANVRLLDASDFESYKSGMPPDGIPKEETIILD